MDTDLAFAFALGQALDRAGHDSVPARNAQVASELIREHKLSIDLLVIDPTPAAALPFIRWLHAAQGRIPTIGALPPGGPEIADLSWFAAVRRKPRELKAAPIWEWVRTVQSFSNPAEPTAPNPARSLWTLRSTRADGTTRVRAFREASFRFA